MRRCPWARTELEIAYHDDEWGAPLHDDRRLFELLVLEGAQAGLSWSTILNKRENYRRAFDRFDPRKVARYGESKLAQLMANPGIVRNRLKLSAAVANAKACLAVQAEFDSLDAYLWSFVKGRPILNVWRTVAEVPAQTPESVGMSRDLLRRGFRFAGPTICYAFMQAAGLVNDHLTDCFRYAELKASGKTVRVEGSQ